MIEAIVNFFVDTADFFSDWWMNKVACHLEKKHPQQFGK